MSFLAPGWLGTALLGLGAAAVPIVIHLLFRTRFRVVPWAAMQFLRKSLEETTRRIKFQELILLLLRIALLLLLALALMRPSSRRVAGQGGAPVDAVFILDASGSMAVTDAGQTRLDSAKAAALRLLDSLPPQSTVRIVRAAAHSKDLGPASPTNRDQARFIVQQLEPTHESTQWLPALQKANEVLTRGSLANKEVYLFSDMQRSAWEKDGPAVQSILSELQQLGEVILVHAGDGHVPGNATIMNLRPQVALPTTGERIPFIVEVRNTGSSELQGMTVTLRGSDSERDVDTQSVPTLKPGEITPITITGRLDRRGKNLVTAELHGDQLGVDNRLDYLVETRDSLKILIVDGRLNEADPAKTASYFLAHALRSARAQRRENEPGQIQLDLVSPSAAYPALLADVHVCFLVGLGSGERLSPEFVQRLNTFVRTGGGLIAFPNPESEAAPDGLADLPARWGRVFTRPPQEPLTYDIKSIPNQSFLGAFRFAPLDRLGQAETTAGRTLEQFQPDAQVLLRFSDGTPALLACERGQGTVILSAVSADLRGSDAPLRPSFVPVVQAMVGHVLNHQSGRKNLIAGEAYSWTPPLDLTRQRFRLIPPAPAQSKLLGEPRIVGGHATITTTETSQAGFYRLIPESASAEETGSDTGTAGDLFAVVPDPAETADLMAMTRDQLDARFGREPLHLSAAQLSTEGLDRSRVQREWTETLFWVLLLLCFGELAFSWFCNREV